MPETNPPKRYTSKEIKEMLETMSIPPGEEGNEMEATMQVTFPVTLVLYRNIGTDGDNSGGFTAYFYHDNSDTPGDPDEASSSFNAEIINCNDVKSPVTMDDITYLFKLDPDKPLWELVIDPNE